MTNIANHFASSWNLWLSLSLTQYYNNSTSTTTTTVQRVIELETELSLLARKWYSTNERRPLWFVCDHITKHVSESTTLSCHSTHNLYRSIVHFIWRQSHKLLSECMEAALLLFPLTNSFMSLCFLLDKYQERAKITVSEMVGVIAAQSISERFTQGLLNSFHHSGTKICGVVSGLQRILDIFDAVKKTKTPFMQPLPHHAVGVSIFGCCDAAYLMFTSDGFKQLCFEINDPLDFYSVKNTVIKYLKSKHIYDTVCDLNGHKCTIKILDQQITLQRAARLLDNVMKLKTDGLPDAVEAVELYEGDFRVYFDSYGIPFEIGHIVEEFGEEVALKVESSDMRWMERTLGIEAALGYLVKEVRDTLSKEGIDVDIRHIQLVMEHMATKGKIAANRYVSADMSEGVFRKATFEQGSRTLCNAASWGCTDKVECPSSGVLMGKLLSIGPVNVEIVQNIVEKTPTPTAMLTPPGAAAAAAAEQEEALYYIPASPCGAASVGNSPQIDEVVNEKNLYNEMDIDDLL